MKQILQTVYENYSDLKLKKFQDKKFNYVIA